MSAVGTGLHTMFVAHFVIVQSLPMSTVVIHYWVVHSVQHGLAVMDDLRAELLVQHAG